jgi:hypothetical protein
MIPWRMLWKADALILSLAVGCSSTPNVVRVQETGHGTAVVHIPRTTDLPLWC